MFDELIFFWNVMRYIFAAKKGYNTLGNTRCDSPDWCMRCLCFFHGLLEVLVGDVCTVMTGIWMLILGNKFPALKIRFDM